ncbi:RluA family pseudouridine synthase [Nitratiruptor sp. YY09-18]|uniref:RluA family pseudouridine synthase n=1 Tax=Nitratiruptor sp. YY09-18 TaxID=2724901 RepID=UPI00191668DA|nr:RluA family pseudouridine synthase [Nitratiruptor sp. YY09-18]BCD67188.1 23S rRNA pseudouridine1911/1915/1917 synthase [Nitratiruptor sp. YY09-18]
MPFVRKIVKTDTPMKLFLLLMRHFHISQKEAQKLIDTGRVYQNGVSVTDKSATVYGEIKVVVFEPQSRGLYPLFETKDFAIFDKPTGIMVHPRNRNTQYSLIDEIKHHFGLQANITHRIDKETSGLVLASKHKEAEKRLKQMFEAKEIKKRYLTLVKGRVAQELFIDEPIKLNRDYSRIKLKVVIDTTGKPAQTIIRPLYTFGDYTLVEAEPLTGRQHQIRIHLFHVKHPIVGDPIYGVDTDTAIRYLDGKMGVQERIEATGAPRLMLHAHTLEFTWKESVYKIFSKQNFVQECFAIANQK